jgi:hypothetical protein
MLSLSREPVGDSLQSVNARAAEIVETLAEFDRSVAAADVALIARDWPQIDALLATQHRLTHALLNALDETRDVRPPAFSVEVDRRIALIAERRADQLRRLIAFNHLVKQRLMVISRTREMRRVNVAAEQAPRILDSMQ